MVWAEVSKTAVNIIFHHLATTLLRDYKNVHNQIINIKNCYLLLFARVSVNFMTLLHIVAPCCCCFFFCGARIKINCNILSFSQFILFSSCFHFKTHVYSMLLLLFFLIFMIFLSFYIYFLHPQSLVVLLAITNYTSCFCILGRLRALRVVYM